MFEELFCRKTVNYKKALLFGFMKRENDYIYETDILDNSFSLKIFITSDGCVDTKLTEKATDDEYILYKTNATGSFVGDVRKAIEDILIQVSEKCFDTDVFRSSQAKEIVCHIRQRYGDEPQFLWERSPDNAIWRRKDTSKWYAAILTISKSKLGLDSSDKAVILNLHAKPEKITELLSKENYYPGWHMNKKHWFTVILDGSVETEEICRHIDESYRLALK